MTVARKLLAALFALVLAAPVFALAQRSYSQPELDQMLAPIALYPDPLLSQILMASTYPVEISAAARWSRAYPGAEGDDAVRAVQDEDWDPSVKSLVAFPQILARMDENPDWTRRLGDAFLMQEPHVMDTVQQLRMKAQAAGNLQSSEQIHVRQQGRTIVLQPASPQFVYVPYYDPLVVYGPWWWPAFQPVYWTPWPGYARPYHTRASVGFWWGRPAGLPVNFFFGNFDWHHRHVRVAHPTAYYYRPPVVANRTIASPHRWRHDPGRREARGIETPRRVAVTSAPAAAPAARAAPIALPAFIATPVRADARREARPQPHIRHEQRQERREERGQKAGQRS